MEDNFVNNVLELYKSKDWKQIVDKYHNYPERSKLLWVYPSEENCVFLKRVLEELGCDAVVSIGCGSGLLEWMLSEATGFPVAGIEVDGAWWHCKYAPPTFIPLLLTSPELDEDTTTLLQKADKTALMFCYFNNRKAFDNYMEYFKGDVLVLIGPADGKGVHTDPKPFGGVSDQWILHGWQEVRSSKDFIAVYRKSDVARR